MTAAMGRAHSPRQAAKLARTARRGALSGSGPAPESAIGRNPGARGAFGLFGEVLLVGILVALISLPLVTMPAALAAATRHLRRYVAAEGSGLDLGVRDFVRALPGGVVVSSVMAVLTALLVADVTVAASGALPGGTVVAAFGWVGLVSIGALMLSSAAAWTPESGWAAAVRSAPARFRADLVGTLYLAAAVVLVGVLTWTLPPLILPALGCAALAAVAIPERPRRSH